MRVLHIESFALEKAVGADRKCPLLNVWGDEMFTLFEVLLHLRCSVIRHGWSEMVEFSIRQDSQIQPKIGTSGPPDNDPCFAARSPERLGIENDLDRNCRAIS